MAPFVFDHDLTPRRLNLGCGFDLREGYLNIDFQDFHSPDLVADVRELTMLPSDSFDEIIAIDVLEHLPRSDTARALSEWARLLRAGGTLELQMPDVTACGRFLIEHDDEPSHTQLMGQLFGTQGYTGDFHLAGFTDVTVAYALRNAGFHRTVLGTRDGWMLTSTSELAPERHREALTIGWLAGFWSAEGSERGVWRWCDRQAELLIVNHLDSPVSVEVSASLSRSPGNQAVVRATSTRGPSPFYDEVIVPESGVTPWRRIIQISPGPLRVSFSTTSELLDVPDPRQLAFRLLNPAVVIL